MRKTGASLSAVAAAAMIFAWSCNPSPDRSLEEAARLVEICDTGAALGAGASAGGEAPSDIGSAPWLAEEDVVCFDGEIEHAVATWFASLERAPRALVIRSVGGNGQAAIDIAERLRAWNTSIIVWDVCLSACAHFAFVGAAKRFVPEPGVVGWHRSLPRTRFEALLLNSADLDASYDSVVRHAFERYRATGRSTIPDDVWLSLPATVTDSLIEFSDSRLRIERLYAQAQIDPAILSAYNVIYRRPPDFIDQSPQSGYYGLQTFWTPLRADLEIWGFGDLVMWEPRSPEHVFELGLRHEPPLLYVPLRVDPGEAPRASRATYGDEDLWPDLD